MDFNFEVKTIFYIHLLYVKMITVCETAPCVAVSSTSLILIIFYKFDRLIHVEKKQGKITTGYVFI